MPTPEESLTVKDVCRQLNCSKESVYRYVKAGEFPRTFRLGNRLRFVQQDVDAYIQRHSAKKLSTT